MYLLTKTLIPFCGNNFPIDTTSQEDTRSYFTKNIYLTIENNKNIINKFCNKLFSFNTHINIAKK